ncbi:MAG TPA: LysR family transcriptional regulator [Eoetvoesiella sp.]
MNTKDIDLNLLRLFDAVYRTRSVSRAAEELDISQPTASQGLARLRIFLRDSLFVRAAGGVRPTQRADRLAVAVQGALGSIEQALNEPRQFDPAQSRRVFRIHMSDIGEGRFLPDLMHMARGVAPAVRIETMPLAETDIADALDSGRIDFAFGFLPKVTATQRTELFSDRYVVLLREGHPFMQRRKTEQASLQGLRSLDFVSVRTHTDTLRILQLLNLDDRVCLTTEHFLVLPDIIRATDLCGLIPRQTACNFVSEGGCAMIEAPFPLRDFSVSLHWSKRFEHDAGNRWLREKAVGLFAGRRG